MGQRGSNAANSEVYGDMQVQHVWQFKFTKDIPVGIYASLLVSDLPHNDGVEVSFVHAYPHLPANLLHLLSADRARPVVRIQIKLRT